MSATQETLVQHLNSQMQHYQQSWGQVARRVAAELCLAEEKDVLDLLPDVSVPKVSHGLIENGWDPEDLTLIAHLRKGGHTAGSLVRYFTTNNVTIETLEAITVRLELAVCAMVEMSRCDDDEDPDEVVAAYWEATRECHQCEGTAALIGMSALLFDEPLFADFVAPICHSDEDDAQQALRNWLLFSLDHAYERLSQ
jgi:hypothetical protein